MNTSQKSFLSIRSKLLAAVAMLLVASFMVVSSTYAWFTLSTAPEVTGITTQVGANGNLEIALNTTNTLPGNGTGLTNVVDKNATWGNIIDLGNAAYGLNTIVLKPSVLAVTKANKVDETPLYTPVYGSDGRVSSVEKNGFYGTWNGNNGFTLQATGATEGYGVRALGTVSSMSAQELQYATSSSNVKTYLDLALNAASTSLRANGGELVTLILKGATNDNPEFDVTTNNEFAPLQAMISKLEEVPENLEVVIQNFMLIALANAKFNETDTNFELMVSTFNANWDTMFAQLKSGAAEVTFSVAGLGENGADLDVTFSVPEQLQAVATTVATIETAVGNAQGKYNEAVADADADGKADWAQLTAILAPLMDINKIKINGETYESVKAMQTNGSVYNWAFGVAQEGVKIGMSEGSGVYANIASVTKDINVNFRANIDVTVNGNNLKMENMNINMYTDLGAGKITNLGNYTAGLKPASKEGADANAVITDTYAYVLDFVFRTNAAGSTLKLQQAATDRIYGDNTDTTSATMGGGSYMEFSTQAGFGDDSVKNLMKNIKLVFVDTKTGELLVGAYLDTATATSDGSTVKAAVKLQAIEAVADKALTGYEEATADTPEENIIVWNEKNCDVTKPIYSELETATLTWGEILEDQNIVDLGQNEATYISVYVYLDGTTITNADVAALSNLSTSGNLNLQFSSSAELKPMDYSGLQNPTT